MGTYLSCGIAKTINVKKKGYAKEVILEKLGKSVNLDIYDEPEETEDYLIFELKKDIMEKYAVEFVKEQLNIAKENSVEPEKIKHDIKDLENKKYDELMEMAEIKRYRNFQYIEGNVFSNDVSYISDGLDIIADIIVYALEGKVIMECYNSIFRYFRNLILKNSTNPIKTAAVVSLIG